jgi:hypothetical protein
MKLKEGGVTMKKFILSLFSIGILFSSGLFTTENASAKESEFHDYYDSTEYRQKKLEDHTAYRDGAKVNCTISRWEIRSVTKCRNHEGETTVTQWHTYIERHHGTVHD